VEDGSENTCKQGKKAKKKKNLIWIRPPLEHGIFFPFLRFSCETPVQFLQNSCIPKGAWILFGMWDFFLVPKVIFENELIPVKFVHNSYVQSLQNST